MSDDRAVLTAAFDAAHAAGMARAVWWRDDDAVRRGPRLERLADLAGRHGASPALAVISAQVAPDLLDWCSRKRLDVLQHGVAHENHEPSGKSAELGPARPAEVIAAELVAARARLEGPAFLPVVVPPWNRMRDDLAPALGAAGYVGVSLFAGPPRRAPIARIDTHLDPIDWRGTRALAPTAARCEAAERAVAQDGPIGLLTHHAVHTADVWDWLADILALVAAHPGARFVTARELFAP